ncbi:hypothetical protein TSTA_021610 [Talaromyces stipitatus ATCC 10500]|uniref:Uncharacterized protein n=1 Tax=Talaromyces stipitatus (strain ATCC 10500 / CBS 375.48 / QM 6759 / NRRL 1006) TaxID=441959 RepID=B8MHC5_TALSN|nr:uncharacterized protein TSTA_021610 [Talaromyces stipitatus ATCC 10500]EED17104.1 hypothetical protein TSTA_021610 [Talaromyces stipitatus ATCC 10500]
MLYGPNIGDPALRKGVAEWHSRLYCLRSPPSTNPDAPEPKPISSDLEPTYFLAYRFFEDAGFQGRLVGVPEDDDGVDVEFLRAQMNEVDQEDTKSSADAEKCTFKNSPQYPKLYRHVIYLVPTFSNTECKGVHARPTRGSC